MAVVREGDEENTEWKQPPESASHSYDDIPRTKRRREPQTARLKDIIGHGPVKVRIEEMILPLGLPRSVLDTVFTGIRSIPTSIFLHGPPGCGKVRSLRLSRLIILSLRLEFFFRHNWLVPSQVKHELH